MAHPCSDLRITIIGPRMDDDGCINRDIRDAMVLKKKKSKNIIFYTGRGKEKKTAPSAT